jgi:predicted nucleotidyltransferase component of viral defense system
LGALGAQNNLVLKGGNALRMAYFPLTWFSGDGRATGKAFS